MDDNKTASNNSSENREEVSTAKPSGGVLTRLVRTARLKVRAMLRKEDPNIYPFF